MSSTSPGMRYRVRELRDADLGAVLELLSLSLGEGRVPRTADFWRWKHERSPFGPSPGLVAESPEGALVGLRVFKRWTLRQGDSTIPAVRAVDTTTHPNWRGLGIFSDLTEHLVQRLRADGVRLVFNTPNATSGAGYLKLGWADHGRVTLWGRPASLVPGLHTSSTLTTPGRALEMVDVPRLIAPGSRHWLHTPLSLDYLLWRYAEPPGMDYFAAADPAGQALVIGRTNGRGSLREALLTETLAQEGMRSALTLARLLRELSRRLDVHYLVAGAPRTREQRIGLLAGGFLPVPWSGPRLFARPLGPPLDLRSWRPSVGDLELF